MWFTVSLEKVTQSISLGDKMMSTQGLLVETVPSLSPWSCGRGRTDRRAEQRDTWRAGCLNLNGDCQTLVREKLMLIRVKLGCDSVSSGALTRGNASKRGFDEGDEANSRKRANIDC